MKKTARIWKFLSIACLALAASSCVKVDGDYVEPNSCEYRLVPNSVQDQFGVFKHCVATAYDSASRSDLIYYYHNKMQDYSEKNYHKSVGIVSKSDRLHGIEQLNFNTLKYPGIQRIMFLPIAKDINGNNSTEAFLFLMFRDSLVFAAYDFENPRGERWVFWESLARPDYHYLFFLANWISPAAGKDMIVFRKSNRLYGRQNAVDTLYAYDLNSLRFIAEKPIGGKIEGYGGKSFVSDSTIIFFSSLVNNGLSYGGLSDSLNYYVAFDLNFDIQWVDTIPSKAVNYPKNSQTDDNVLQFYSTPQSYVVKLYKKSREIEIDSLKVPKNALNNSSRMVFGMQTSGDTIIICFVNCILKIDFASQTYEYLKTPVAIKNWYTNVYLPGMESMPHFLIEGINFFDINGDKIPDFLCSGNENQIFALNSANGDILFASAGSKERLTGVFVRDSSSRARVLIASKSIVKLYDIKKTPLTARILVWGREIAIYSAVFLAVPVLFIAFRRINYLARLFEELTARNKTLGMAILNNRGNIIKANAAFREHFRLPEYKNLSSDEFPEKFNKSFSIVKSRGVGVASEIELDGENLAYIVVNIIEFKVFLYPRRFLATSTDATPIVMSQRRRDALTNALMIAHGIKTPLGVAQLELENMMDTIIETMKGANVFDDSKKIISAGINEAADVIRKISYIAKDVAATSLERIELNSFVKTWIEENEIGILQRDVKLDSKLRDKPIYINANAKSLDLLIITACYNSAESFPVDAADKRIILQTSAVEGVASLSIIDNGAGMDAETLEKVRKNVGHTTKRTGTGLGMQVIRKACAENGAKLIIDSEKDKGTNITIELKLFSEDNSV